MSDLVSMACDIRKENINAHEYFTTVEYIHQMCTDYPHECTAFSCDSKAKVYIVRQAVSRYHLYLMVYFMIKLTE